MDRVKCIHDLMPPEWDRGPYSVIGELKRLLASIVDAGTNIDTGSAADAAYLYAHIGGVEYKLIVSKTAAELSKTSPSEDETARLRSALEAAADRLFDAGLNDAWADARAALEGK